MGSVWRVLLFPESEMGKPQWAVAGSSHLGIVWTPRPAAPEPWVWTPRGQVGWAGRLLPPQDVRSPGWCQGGRGWRGHPVWEEDTPGQLVDSGRPHQDCASVRGVLGHEEVQLVGLSEQAWGGSHGVGWVELC